MVPAQLLTAAVPVGSNTCPQSPGLVEKLGAGHTLQVFVHGSSLRRFTMQVEHDTDTHRFVARAPSGPAVLAYRLKGPGLLELYSTHVPEPDRNQGIGSRLVEAALGYAREEGMRVIPTCPYVSQWIREHPENADLVVAR